jgi:hypothetical protein
MRLRETRMPAPAAAECKKNVNAESEVMRLVRKQLELVGHSAELWKRTRLHLSHRPTAMNLHGSFSDAHIAGNLFAEAAGPQSAFRSLDDLLFGRCTA